MVRAEPMNTRTTVADTNHSNMFTLLLERNVIYVGKGGYSSNDKIVSAELFHSHLENLYNRITTKILDTSRIITLISGVMRAKKCFLSPIQSWSANFQKNCSPIQSWPVLISGRGAVKELRAMQTYRKQKNRHQLCMFAFSNDVDLENDTRNSRKPFWSFCVCE